MSILLFSNDKCFDSHILVYQGRIPLILLLLFLKKYTERCRKTYRDNYGYSIVQIYPGLAGYLWQNADAGSAANSMARGSPAGPDFSSYCGLPASMRRVGDWHPDIIKYRQQDLLLKRVPSISRCQLPALWHT
jgi:hypothetical protein